MNPRIKFKMVKFEKGVAFQILEMDERFRKEENSFETSNRYDNKKIIIKSGTYPQIHICDTGNTAGLYVGLWLRGMDNRDDLRVFSPSFRFNGNAERDIFCLLVTNSLVQWVNGWEGFEEKRIFDFKKEDNTGNHTFYINDEELIKFQLVLFDKAIAFQLNHMHDAFRNKKWEKSCDFINANFVIAYGYGEQLISYCVNRDNIKKGKLDLSDNWANWSISTFDFCTNRDRDYYCEMLFDTLKIWQRESFKYIPKRELKNLGNDIYEI